MPERYVLVGWPDGPAHRIPFKTTIAGERTAA